MTENRPKGRPKTAQEDFKMLNRTNITLRLPNALYEACRRQAFDEKRSLNEIFTEAIREQQNKRTAEEFKRQWKICQEGNWK